MRRFSPGADVLYLRITAADQARFFARLERDGLTWSVAVLTDGNPHSPYAFATLRGVARRLLRGTD